MTGPRITEVSLSGSTWSCIFNFQGPPGCGSRSLSEVGRCRDNSVSYFRAKVYGLVVQVTHPLSPSSWIQVNKNKKIRPAPVMNRWRFITKNGFDFDFSLKEVEIEKWIEVFDDDLQSKNEMHSKRFLYWIENSGWQFRGNTVVASRAAVYTSAYFALQNVCWNTKTCELHPADAGWASATLKKNRSADIIKMWYYHQNFEKKTVCGWQTFRRNAW